MKIGTVFHLACTTSTQGKIRKGQQPCRLNSSGAYVPADLPNLVVVWTKVFLPHRLKFPQVPSLHKKTNHHARDLTWYAYH